MTKKLLAILCLLNLSLMASAGQCLQESKKSGHWDDVLLMINFNHAYYKNIPFLRELYGQSFPNIVFYGPEEHPDVELCPHYMGYYSYEVIRQAMEKFPDYKGYLFLHDDCVLNHWNLVDFDKNKVWVSLHDKYIGDITLGLAARRWSWWDADWQGGYRASQVIHDILKIYPDYKKYYNNLAKNYGPNGIPMWFSDVLYVPERLKEEAKELSRFFKSHTLFLEIAIPMMAACMDEESNWEVLNGLQAYTADMNTINERYTTEMDYFHPMKFSDTKLREFIMPIFKEHSK